MAMIPRLRKAFDAYIDGRIEKNMTEWQMNTVGSMTVLLQNMVGESLFEFQQSRSQTKDAVVEDIKVTLKEYISTTVSDVVREGLQDVSGELNDMLQVIKAQQAQLRSGVILTE